MKHSLLTFWLTALMMLFGQSLSAHEFEVDGIYYNYWSRQDKTVSVTYKGNGSNKYSGNVVIPESVTYSGTTYSVTSIGSNAFESCTGLTSIEIPNSVTSIGSSAFIGCTSLTSIEIPNSVTSIGNDAFHGCTGLTSIEIPNGLTSISNDAFNGCTGLTSIVIPNSVTRIGHYAFAGCKGLTSIEIPNSVTYIGEQAFSGCTGLTSIVIPNSVTSIGDYAFNGCTGKLLIHCNIDNATSSYYGWFYGSKFKEVVIGEEVTRIGSYAFDNCSGLTSIEIPNSVTSIGNYAFNGCSSLTSINIPNSVTSIGAYAFNGCTGKLLIHCNIGNATSSKLGWFYGSKFNEVEIGEEVTSIGSFAFVYCTSITKINIPNSVTSIGDYAFFGCSNLQYNKYDNALYLGNLENRFVVLMKAKNKNVDACVIADNCKFIYNDAFNGCTGLSDIIIPENVTSIGVDAFKNCNNLKKVYNNSALTLTPGSSDYGYVAYYSEVVYNNCRLDGDYVITYVNDIPYVCGYLGQDTELTLPAMYGIGDYAFYDCKDLINVSIPNGVTSIGKAAFYGCSGLASIEIPNSVKGIGKSAFYGCTSLPSIEIPNSVTSIGSYAFYGCKGLTSINIPNCVTSIGDYTFYNCAGLTNFVIPSSVTSIGGSAFYGCNNLKKVYNWSSLTLTPGSSSYGYVAYYATSVYNNCCLDGDYVITDIDGKPYVCGYFGQETELTLPATDGVSDYAFNGCKVLTKITIPNGVKSIGENAFSGCSGLTSIEIPNSVTSIGKNAFKDCTGTLAINCDIEDAENSDGGWFYGSKFSEVILGEAVNKVGKYAFYGLTSIKSLTIGGNVNRIGYYAFDNCTGLTSIYSNAVTPPACRDNAFHEDTKWDCSLYVPKESIDAYKAANVWKDFLSIKENPYYSSLESVTITDNKNAPLYDLQGSHVVAPRPNALYIRNGKKVMMK